MKLASCSLSQFYDYILTTQVLVLSHHDLRSALFCPWCLQLLHGVVICIAWRVVSVLLRRYLFCRWHCVCYCSVSCLCGFLPLGLWGFRLCVGFLSRRGSAWRFLSLAWLRTPKRPRGIFSPCLGAVKNLHIIHIKQGNGPSYAICGGDNTGQKKGNESQK